jgi:predicted methyltransferase
MSIMLNRIAGSMTIALAMVAAIGMFGSFAAPSFALSPPLAATIAQTAPIPAAAIPKEITAAINAPDRPAADKKLDAGRKPDQIMAFYGIKPGMKVADVFAGGGYMTELESRIVGPTGTVYSQNMPFPERFKKTGEAWEARLKSPALKNVVAIRKPFDAPDLLPVPPGALDAVIIHLNYHDLVGFKLHPENVNAAVFKALKPGGIYGIVDHSAKAGTAEADASTLHRIDENFEIAQIEKAGFKLAGASSALRHPEDDRTWKVFEHRGETDRFMLKFVKPQ